MKMFIIFLITSVFFGNVYAFEPSYVDYFSNSEFKIYKLQEKAYEFSIPYHISDAELEKIVVDCDSSALIVYLDNVGTDGNFVINIPRSLLDVKINQRDDDFIVILDQLEVEYIETNTESDSRTLDIPLRQGEKILEIIATSVGMFPEPIPCGVGDVNDSPYYRLLSPLKQFKSGILVDENQFVKSNDDFKYPVPGGAIIAHLYSLKTQIESGLSYDELRCNEGHVLIQKYDGSPACVTPETKIKLIERGWAYEETENILSSKYTVFEDVEKLLSENKIDYLPDKLVVTSGISIRGDSGCGAVIDSDSKTHWFGIDSISNPTKMTLYSENPQQCMVNTISCFCNAQIELASLTIDELNYFTSTEEEKYSEILIDYLYDQNINRTPKFQIGKLNINYTDSDAIGYCGHIWGTNTYGFFSGAIVNDIVEDYGINKELPLLCAISENAKWWDNEN